MPKDPSIKKVLVIGSGPIIIGQAAEFDYSGTQACRALKSEGIEVVLVNSNPATIMTDPDIADRVYVEPMTLTVLKRIIEKEKPDSILPNLGGQTGLNLAMELARSGYLEQAGVRLLGAKPDTIDRAEDRQLFKDTMEKLGEPVIPSKVVESLSDALAFAGEIGYPVIVRPAFTMGGTGGGICETVEELHEIGTNGLRLSPIHQVLIEKCISGWKEIEYEVMRDGKGNVITVCNMENFDPVGVHTGDSIVVAPSQTLSDKEYQMLRTSALNIITELGIEGGCNCQFALKPDSFEYAVIEVNPRVSRSSALASKATGYPIAKVAAKIAIGYSLDEITNDVTGQTCACFEPALDYCVVKFPKWPFDKFVYAKKSLGTQMMATGEVMAIANSFEHAFMKAVQSIELGLETPTLETLSALTDEEVVEKLHVCDSDRSFVVYEAIKRPGDRFAGAAFTSGSAGTMSAGDLLKEKYPHLKLAVGEALQCPTILENGFGGHRIEGIGDKHIPWIHNVKNTDMVIDIDDEDSQRLLRLFNTPEGQAYLKNELHLDDELIEKLTWLGISGIANVLCCIKMAKYYEFTERDVVGTVLTDSAVMYGSRIQELNDRYGAYNPHEAAMDHALHMLGLKLDNMQELTYADRKRVHNLKYYTWVEQQGKTVEELNALWYDTEGTWDTVHAQAKDLDDLINAFNEATGLLKDL